MDTKLVKTREQEVAEILADPSRVDGMLKCLNRRKRKIFQAERRKGRTTREALTFAVLSNA